MNAFRETKQQRVGLASYLTQEQLGPWEIFLNQIEEVLPWLDTELQQWIETLRRPKRILIVDVPIKRDNGVVVHYEGYRVQHNLSRGPGKGGIRFHPNVNLTEVMALAAWMSVKKRCGQRALWRRQRRHSRRSAASVAERTRAADAPLHQ